MSKYDLRGASFGGGAKASEKIKLLYNVEYAEQNNSTRALDTDYLWLELGLAAKGIGTFKVGQEVLSSGTNAAGTVTESFSTPYATIHKFQGWADVFAGQGLFGAAFGGVGVEDTYVSATTKKFGMKFTAVYHVFEPEASASYDRFGDELDVLVVKPINKKLKVAAKWANFQGRADSPTADKDVFWAWAEIKI